MQNTDLLAHIISPLLYWYAEAARNLPWRADPTPYHVWISEIMLQQTRVEAVKPYYARFTEALPDVGALANVSDDALNKLWQGLGYYSRARNLKKAAILLCEQYGGALPADYETLLSLPGIGAYTAGAIASIAFGLPEPAVDGNVLRVITRLTETDDDISKQETKNAVTAALRQIYPRDPDDAGRMTQALMELGATVCIPAGTPKCRECPLSDLCLAHKNGREEQYPKKASKRPRTHVDRTVCLLSSGGRYAVQKRPGKGLLAGLWEFPSVDGILDSAGVAALVRSFGCEPEDIRPLPPSHHIFTHIEWHMTSYAVTCREGSDTALVWAHGAELRDIYCIPSAYRSQLAYVTEEMAKKPDD